MNFDLPEISNPLDSIPDLSLEECAAAPSTTLMSLANNLGGSLSEIADQAQALKARYDKIKGEISAVTSGDGKSVIDTIQSIAKVGTSIQESIGPVQSTISVFTSIADTTVPGEDTVDALTNMSEAGTSTEDVESFTDKISGYFSDLGSLV